MPSSVAGLSEYEPGPLKLPRRHSLHHRCRPGQRAGSRRQRPHPASGKGPVSSERRSAPPEDEALRVLGDPRGPAVDGMAAEADPMIDQQSATSRGHSLYPVTGARFTVAALNGIDSSHVELGRLRKATDEARTAYGAAVDAFAQLEGAHREGRFGPGVHADFLTKVASFRQAASAVHQVAQESRTCMVRDGRPPLARPETPSSSVRSGRGPSLPLTPGSWSQPSPSSSGAAKAPATSDVASDGVTPAGRGARLAPE
jgi:hypothetical protein